MRRGCSDRTVLEKTAPRNETKNLLNKTKQKTHGKYLAASNLWVVYIETLLLIVLCMSGPAEQRSDRDFKKKMF